MCDRTHANGLNARGAFGRKKLRLRLPGFFFGWRQIIASSSYKIFKFKRESWEKLKRRVWMFSIYIIYTSLAIGKFYNSCGAPFESTAAEWIGAVLLARSRRKEKKRSIISLGTTTTTTTTEPLLFLFFYPLPSSFSFLFGRSAARFAFKTHTQTHTQHTQMEYVKR